MDVKRNPGKNNKEYEYPYIYSKEMVLKKCHFMKNEGLTNIERNRICLSQGQLKMIFDYSNNYINFNTVLLNEVSNVMKKKKNASLNFYDMYNVIDIARGKCHLKNIINENNVLPQQENSANKNINNNGHLNKNKEICNIIKLKDPRKCQLNPDNNLSVNENMLEKEKQIIMLQNKIADIEARLSKYEKRIGDVSDECIDINDEFQFLNNTFNDEKDCAHTEETLENKGK